MQAAMGPAMVEERRTVIRYARMSLVDLLILRQA